MKDKLGADIWYCDPHAPWQRGTIENTNGILRRDMPRKTDITDYSRKDITMIQLMVNSTPRKCLNFKTPEEAFIQKLISTNDERQKKELISEINKIGQLYNFED